MNLHVQTDHAVNFRKIVQDAKNYLFPDEEMFLGGHRSVRPIYRMRFRVFVMAVTAAEISRVVVKTVNTFVMFSCFACSANHC